MKYSATKQVPFFGFGANVQGTVHHCFNLNFQPNPEVHDVQGMLDAYRQALSMVGLSGPTLFAQIVRNAVSIAQQAWISQGNQQYFVLFILTDGDIHDMRETIDWVVQGSLVPLSIIIVGVGNDNFGKMVELDADEVPLIDSHGRKMARDIVQFVPFREVGNSPTRLAKEVLDELPREVVNFFKRQNIMPNPPLQAVAYSDSMVYENPPIDPAMLQRQMTVQNAPPGGMPSAPPPNLMQPPPPGMYPAQPGMPPAPGMQPPPPGMQPPPPGMQMGVPMQAPAAGNPYAYAPPPGAQQGMPAQGYQPQPQGFSNMMGQFLVNQNVGHQNPPQ